jgi:hypothetical protein
MMIAVSDCVCTSHQRSSDELANDTQYARSGKECSLVYIAHEMRPQSL